MAISKQFQKTAKIQTTVQQARNLHYHHHHHHHVAEKVGLNLSGPKTLSAEVAVRAEDKALRAISATWHEYGEKKLSDSSEMKTYLVNDHVITYNRVETVRTIESTLPELTFTVQGLC
jgi:hypothetical protein